MLVWLCAEDVVGVTKCALTVCRRSPDCPRVVVTSGLNLQQKGAAAAEPPQSASTNISAAEKSSTTTTLDSATTVVAAEQAAAAEAEHPAALFWVCRACRMPRNRVGNSACYKCHASRGSEHALGGAASGHEELGGASSSSSEYQAHTGSLLACSSCKGQLPEGSFSSSQLAKECARRCKGCVAQQENNKIVERNRRRQPSAASQR